MEKKKLFLSLFLFSCIAVFMILQKNDRKVFASNNQADGKSLNLPGFQNEINSQEEEIPDFDIFFTDHTEGTGTEGGAHCLTRGVKFVNKSSKPITIELLYIKQTGEKFTLSSGLVSPNSSNEVTQMLGVVKIYDSVSYVLPYTSVASFYEDKGFDLYYPVNHPCNGYLGTYVSETISQSTTQPNATSTKATAETKPTQTEMKLLGNVTASISCYAKVESSEENICTVSIYPDGALSDVVFDVAWFIDGNWAFTSSNQSITIPPLPPGKHEISVIVSSQETNATASAYSMTEVTDSGMVAPLPQATQDTGNQISPPPTVESTSSSYNQTGQVTPVGQAASAVVSLSVLAAWLWLEYRNNSTSYNQNQERLQQQINRDNSERRDWFDQRSQENQDFRNRQLIDQGYLYNSDTGTWEPGPNHPDYGAANIRRQMGATASGLRNLIRNLPPNQQIHISELIDSVTYDGDMNNDALAELNRLRNAIFLQIQGQNESGQAAAEMDQIDADSNIGWAQNIQRLNTLAALLATGGSILLNPAALAAVNGELAAIQLVGNFTAGAAGGYVEGGLTTAAIRVAQNILPVNTISSLVDHESSWGDVALSAVRDVGNTLSLVQGGSYLQQQLTPGTSGAISGAVDDFASSGDDILLTARSSADDIARSGDDVVAAGRGSADDIARSGDDVIETQRHLLNNQQRELQEIANQKIDPFRQLVDEYNNPATSGARRLELEELMNQAANEIKANYQATNIIKHSDDINLQQAFNAEIRRTYNRVDLDLVDDLNRQGVRIGGRPVSVDDFTDFRNNLSAGSVGMDRDLAQNQQLIQGIRNRLNQATPGSQEAHDLQDLLMRAHTDSRITIDGQPISNANANELFQQTYNNSFLRVTGQNADDALQMVTYDQHVEAYADLNVLQNAPTNIPFQANLAGQTASVNVHKFDSLINQIKNGQIPEANGIQEIFRGTAKEITNKIEPLMSANINASPEKLQRLIVLRDYLSEAGKGKIPIGDAIAEIKNTFGTDWINLPEQLSAQFEILIKNQ